VSGRLRIAVVGAGNIAQQHLPVLTQHPLCDVAVLCDRDPAILAATADRFAIPGRAADVADVLRRDDLDAAFVLVSHRATVAVAGAFLDAGMPVLLEKPPGMYSNQTARLAEIQERRGTLHMVGLNRRFYASHLAARAWLGQHGPLASLTLEAHEDLTRMTTSRFLKEELPLMQRRRAYANGIHALDLIRYFGGEVAEVQALRAASVYPFPDSFGAVLRFSGAPGAGGPGDSGRSDESSGSGGPGEPRQATPAIGRVSMDFFAPGQHRFDLTTANARLESDRPFLGVTLHVRGEPSVRFEPDEDDVRFKPGFWKQDTTFLEGVRRGRQPAAPAATLVDAYQTMRLIDRICGSGETGETGETGDAGASGGAS
jgi:predicted dehydrogenase